MKTKCLKFIKSNVQPQLSYSTQGLGHTCSHKTTCLIKRFSLHGNESVIGITCYIDTFRIVTWQHLIIWLLASKSKLTIGERWTFVFHELNQFRSKSLSLPLKMSSHCLQPQLVHWMLDAMPEVLLAALSLSRLRTLIAHPAWLIWGADLMRYNKL